MTDLSTPPPLPSAAERALQPADPAAQAAAAAAMPLPTLPPAPGELRGTFSSKRAAASVVLDVDGHLYQCATTAPSDPLVLCIEARETGDNVALYQAIRTLIVAVMYPEDRARYEARLAGQTDQGGPIGIEECLAHGLWLVGAYLGRPTDGPAPSGVGPTTQQ